MCQNKEKIACENFQLASFQGRFCENRKFCDFWWKSAGSPGCSTSCDYNFIECSVCGKSFADRSNMTLHHRLHSGVKPFACPVCPKAFTKKHHLKTHINYHTGHKPYTCPHANCGQTFTQSSNMRTHAKKCQFKPPEQA
uniref:Zinc finger protein squeeze n=2 Tax=Culex pipiens TaxID=7175 RepID=A0A8D8BJH0_CULPI